MKRTIASFLTSLLLLAALLLLSACGGGGETLRPAQYGTYGRDVARNVARHFAYRSSGSETEKRAADYLGLCFSALGYESEIRTFSYVDARGVTQQSQNVIARLDGQGFGKDSEKGGSEPAAIVIGAGYDVPISGPHASWLSDLGLDDEVVASGRDYGNYNGIHDNASGVATVLTAAWQMQSDQPGYDVVFVLFGASRAGNAGARAFLAEWEAAGQKELACMYEVGPVYAGEKVYAHAGQSSLLDEENKNYLLRRKLYEVTDIFYNYLLNTYNGYSLYTNQASFLVSRPGGTQKVVFREWTQKQSDYTPFDELGIPIVFFESGDYDVESLAELGPENRDPAFRESGGLISGTPYDEEAYLFNVFRRLEEASQTEPLLPTPSPALGPDDIPLAETLDSLEEEEIDRLTQRINNTAFILVKAAQRGYGVRLDLP